MDHTHLYTDDFPSFKPPLSSGKSPYEGMVIVPFISFSVSIEYPQIPVVPNTNSCPHQNVKSGGPWDILGPWTFEGLYHELRHGAYFPMFERLEVHEEEEDAAGRHARFGKRGENRVKMIWKIHWFGGL